MAIKFEDANAALNSVLLGGQFEGRPLYLSLGLAAKQALAEALGTSADEVESEVCSSVGRSLLAAGDPYERHYQAARRWWTASRDQPPPFTALLFAFSHAASLMAADNSYGGGAYYARLAGVTGYSDTGRLSFHGRSTEYFWLKFNAWLTSNDYEAGRPTARAFNSNRYINYPQTQAIVRAGDRPLFHDLFERFGFTGSELLGVDDIRPYVETWITGSKANHRLKGAWEKRELRDRLCEVVIAELEEWSLGETGREGGAGTRSLRLALAAVLQKRLPRPYLGLFLAQPGNPGYGATAFRTPSGRAATASNSVFGSLKTIEPTPFPAAMTHGYHATAEGGGLTAGWTPRLVVPLERSAEGPYWLEALRVRLGGEYLVLVRDVPALLGHVDAYLSQASTQEAKVARPGAFDGIPPGWVAYTCVRIIKPGVGAKEDVAPLVPLGKDLAELSFVGGMRLARGIWHAHAPPDTHFLSSVASVRLEAGPPGQAPRATASDKGRFAILPGTALAGFEESEFDVRAFSGTKHASTASLLLRSASKPRALSRQGEGILTYWCAGSAIRGGAKLAAVVLPTPGGGDAACIAATALPVGPDHGAGEGARQVPCIQRGGHHWLGAYYPPGTKAPPLHPVRCKDCQSESLVGKPPGGLVNAARPTDAVTWETARPSAGGLDHDLMLDALCFLGSGGIGRIEALMGEHESDPGAAHALARSYSALGFLDLELEPGTGRVAAWSVPPQAACFTSGGEAVMTGFRSRETCEALKEAVREAGGQASFVPSVGRPARLAVSGLAPERFADLADRLRDGLGRPIAVLSRAAEDIVQQAEALAPLSQLLRPLGLSWQDAEKTFDFQEGYWKGWEGPGPAGAYRLRWAGRTFCWVSKGGEAFSGPPAVVVLAAARDAGVRLHEYDGAQQRFISPRACEPPGLVARALVACSGHEPLASKGSLAYRSVPAHVAAGVFRLLYEDPLP